MMDHTLFEGADSTACLCGQSDNYQGSSGAFSFADGHSEIKRWTDNIKNRSLTGVSIAGFTPTPADPHSTDLSWVQ